MPNVRDTKSRLEELGIRPSKSLGQNFLVNDRIVEIIVDAVKNLSPEAIVEVGPGLGALTNPLTQLEKNLTVIELDKDFADLWRQKGIASIEKDALKLDWKELDLPENSVLVSNLPYQISSSLVIERSIQPCGISAMVLMFQKEVAQRIVEKTKGSEYGMLSVMSQVFWDIQTVCDAGPKDFHPVPNVGSRVLQFVSKQRNGDWGVGFLKMVKIAFAQRRKLLLGNLKKRFDQKSLIDHFGQIGIAESARPQDVSPEQYVSLFEKLKASES